MVRYRPDGTPLPQVANLVFGCKRNVIIDRRVGFICMSKVASAAHNGREICHVIDLKNTASDIEIDSASRSQKN